MTNKRTELTRSILLKLKQYQKVTDTLIVTYKRLDRNEKEYKNIQSLVREELRLLRDRSRAISIARAWLFGAPFSSLERKIPSYTSDITYEAAKAVQRVANYDEQLVLPTLPFLVADISGWMLGTAKRGLTSTQDYPECSKAEVMLTPCVSGV